MEISQTNDQDYMRLALAEARLAEEAGEVPIGAVVVCNGEVIAPQKHSMPGASPTARSM